MRSPLFLGLLLVAALLAAIAWQEIRAAAPLAGTSGGTSEARAPSAPAASPPGAAADAPRLEAMVATILARPVFEPSRRPPAADAGPAAAAPVLPRLTGIIVTPGGNSAIFASPGSGRSLVLAEGERVNGFLVQSIAADRVVVIGGNGRHVLQPSFDKTAPKAASAPASAPAFTPAAAPATPAGPAQRPTMPGLTGRPLGLAAQPDQSAGASPPPFPSLAAPEPAQ